MSTALYRLGRWCATHARRVLVLWLVVLVGAGALAATISQPLGNGFTIPGANFEKVRQQLGEEIPKAAGGFGTVVLSSDTAFTPAQRAAVEDVFAAWGEVPNVSRVINPFEAQDQLDAGQAQLADAKVQLDAGQKGIDEGQAKLAEGEGQLAAGEAVLAQLEETNPQDPSIPGLRAQLTQGRAELEKGRAELEKGIAELAAGRASYEDGVAISRATEGTRLVSEDGRYAVAQVQFDTDAQSVPVENRAMIPDTAKDALAAAGVTADYSVEITQDTALIGAGEIIGLTVALLVLVAVLGSLIAAGLPLLVALLGVGVGIGGAIAFTAVTELNQMTPALALMLGLAVGIDYALFIVTRHRTSLLHGQDLVESISRAVGTAGSAVVFAGLTVVIALTALVLSGLPILAEMGLVAAFTVAVTVLVAVTVSPALLRLMGTRVISRRGWRAAGFATPGDPTSRTTPDDGTDEEHGGWFVRLVTLRPWLTVLAVVGVLGVLAIPVGSIQLGLPDGGREPTGTTAHTAYTTVGEQFGPGINGPIVAVTTLPEELRPTDEASLANVQAMIATRLKVIDGRAQRRAVRGQPRPGDPGLPGRAHHRACRPRDRRDVPPRGVHGIPARAAREHQARPDRPDRGEHRGLGATRRGAAGLPRRRRGAVGPHPAARLPLARRAAHRHRRLPAVDRRGLRRHRRGSPVGVARCSVRCAPGRAAAVGDADHHHRRAVRAGDGLPDVPRLRHARGPLARRGLTHRGAHRVRPRRQGRDGRGDHHDLGLPRVRVLAPGDGAADRVRAGGRCSLGCRAHPDDAHPGSHAPARRPCLVPAAVARPDPARPRRRGGSPGGAPRLRRPGQRHPLLHPPPSVPTTT
jgi:hypothetical protein